MKLIDYIMGSRRGREANRVERDAEADPFLSDAIEGYDAVYGNHKDKLKELDEMVAKRAAKRNKGKVKIAPLTDAPRMMPVGEEPKAAAASSRAVAMPVADKADSGIPAAKKKPSKKSIAAAQEMPAAEQAAAQVAAAVAAIAAETEEIPAAVATKPAAEMKAAEMKAAQAVPLADDESAVPAMKKRGGGRRVLKTMLAAAVVLLIAGGAWYFFDTQLKNTDMQLALDFSATGTYSTPDTHDPTVVLPFEVFEEELIACAVNITVDPHQQMQAVAQATGQQTQAGAQATDQQRRARNDRRSVEIEKVEPVISEGIKLGKSLSELSMSVGESSQSVEIAAAGIEGADSDMDEAIVTGYSQSTKAMVAADQPAAQSEEEMAVSRRTAPAAVEAQPTAQPDAAATISNPAFANYFTANSKLLAEGVVKGRVVVEFKVNNRGVPTSIKVISSPSPEAGSEVVDLLVSGPKWTPSNGERVRTTVEYK